MTMEFKLPELGEGVESAEVAELAVAEGDTVEAEQIVMELETEKAVVELPCSHAGTVTKIHVAEGDTVQVGQTLLTLDVAASGDEVVKESAAVKPSEPPPAAKPQAVAVSPPMKVEAVEESDSAERDQIPVPAGPATRRLARELGVDLRQVAGSGSGGRITPEDVQAYVRSLTSGGAATGGEAVVAPPLPDFSKWGEIERRPLNKIARASAKNLTASWRTIPHVTQHDLADITEIEAARRRYMKGAGQSGPKITMTALLVKAVVAALKEFPHVNASLDAARNELILKGYYHIGVAVDTENGLLVPVIHNADSKSVVTIAAELTDLADRARRRKLKLDEMQGATFTVTNLGGIGGIGFTPIVNHPEVAILGVSRGRPELQLIDGQPRERLMLPLSLSYDHRVINGADAARFVAKLCRDISDSFQLLIET